MRCIWEKVYNQGYKLYWDKRQIAPEINKTAWIQKKCERNHNHCNLVIRTAGCWSPKKTKFSCKGFHFDLAHNIAFVFLIVLRTFFALTKSEQLIRKHSEKLWFFKGLDHPFYDFPVHCFTIWANTTNHRNAITVFAFMNVGILIVML